MALLLIARILLEAVGSVLRVKPQAEYVHSQGRLVSLRLRMLCSTSTCHNDAPRAAPDFRVKSILPDREQSRLTARKSIYECDGAASGVDDVVDNVRGLTRPMLRAINERKSLQL